MKDKFISQRCTSALKYAALCMGLGYVVVTADVLSLTEWIYVALNGITGGIIGSIGLIRKDQKKYLIFDEEYPDW